MEQKYWNHIEITKNLSPTSSSSSGIKKIKNSSFSFESLEDLNKEDKINCDQEISSQNIARQRLNKHFILDYVISSEWYLLSILMN